MIEYLEISNSGKALYTLLILWLSLWQQAKENPFMTEDLNSSDFKSTYIVFVTIFAGLISYIMESLPINIIVLCIILIVNILFLYHWAKIFLIVKWPTYKDFKYIKMFKRFFQNIESSKDH